MKFIIVLSFLVFSISSIAQHLPAHAHNDYLHERPLHEALEANFRSIEVDVFSIEDSLFVAHDLDKIKKGRTIRSMYLNPLKIIYLEKKSNLIKEEQGIILLVDIKDDGLETCNLLSEILNDYKEMLTVYRNGKLIHGAVTIIISGNRPIEYLKDQNERFLFYDGRISELELGIPNNLMPLVSDNWNRHFNWRGKGEMPNNEKEKLKSFVNMAHKQGYMLRFWATPERPLKGKLNVWNELKHANVDLIGTDDIQGLKEFLLN